MFVRAGTVWDHVIVCTCGKSLGFFECVNLWIEFGIGGVCSCGKKIGLCECVNVWTEFEIV